MSEAVATQEDWKPKSSPWLITAAVMLATFIAALNSSIANVALKQIAGSFSISQDESLWVITSYLIASSIILPATAWFSSVIGRKKFFLSCIVLFATSSFICGTAPTIEILLIGRVLQGLGGGVLFPLSQAILLESFPREKHGLAMSVFGLGVVLAPIIGPLLGGWLTSDYSWNWIFFISLPFCIAAFIMIQIYVEDPPYMRAQGMQKVDFVGFILLIIWLAAFQVMLDNGQKSGWFGSEKICKLTFVWVSALIAFVWWELKNKTPLVDLRIFKNWNFTIGTILYTVIFVVFYGSMAILPLFLQSLLGYTSFLSGLAGAPMGVGSLIGILCTAVLAGRMDYRWQAAIGLALLCVASFMFSSLNLSISLINVVVPNMLLGFAIAMVITPLTTLIFSNVSNSEMTNASGLQNLLKNVGSAIGISLVGVMVSRYSQIYQGYLVDHMHPLNPVFKDKLAALTAGLAQHMNPVVAAQKANFMMYGNLIKQSTLLAFMQSYKIYAITALVLLPLLALVKKVSYKK